MITDEPLVWWKI